MFYHLSIPEEDYLSIWKIGFGWNTPYLAQCKLIWDLGTFWAIIEEREAPRQKPCLIFNFSSILGFEAKNTVLPFFHGPKIKISNLSKEKKSWLIFFSRTSEFVLMGHLWGLASKLWGFSFLNVTDSPKGTAFSEIEAQCPFLWCKRVAC